VEVVYAQSVVQKTYTSNTHTTLTTASQSYGSSVTAGHILIAALMTSKAVSAISLSGGCSGTWTEAGSLASNTATASEWYCASASGGTTTVAAHWTTGTAYVLDVFDTSGYTTTGLTCTTGTGSGTSASVTSLSFSSGALLIGAYGVSATGTITLTASFTTADKTTTDFGHAEYATSGITSPTTFAVTLGTTASWAGIGCQFPVASQHYTFSVVETVSVKPAVQNNVVQVAKATVSITPSVAFAVAHKVAAAVSVIPSVTMAVAHKVAATISIVPSLVCELNGGTCTSFVHYVYTVAVTVSVTPSAAMAVAHKVAATVSITPALTCFYQGNPCSNLVHYVYTLAVTVAVRPAFACITNGNDCDPGGFGSAGPDLLTPTALFIAGIVIGGLGGATWMAYRVDKQRREEGGLE
jgi:hypothetical protein